VLHSKRDTPSTESRNAVLKFIAKHQDYSVHPVFGFLPVRIQTWFPFSIQICLNGCE